MSVVKMFEGFATILAEIDPEKVVNLQAPESMAKHLEKLIHKKKDEILSEGESKELERYLTLDLIINLAKAEALRMLNAAKITRFRAT